MNIWSFLLQTLTVSLVALFLLFIKRIFADKLSPRWQYSVWGLLALRILIPVSPDRVILLPFSAYITTLKNTVELRLDSAYSAAFGSAPFAFTKPHSVTDLVFIIYIAGVAATLLYYTVGYIRLRVVIRCGTPVSVCDKCRAVVLDGIPSAFVCGFIRPVLVLPNEQVDEKILTHELMHLKHHDALQNAFWCLLRALHWCNPFMHYVFNRIGNDMESLCDSRVLETLNGEELRDYGRILLSMANDRYARAAGTTSISNGGKNISRRIEAIVRYKQYPRGISFASVCIVAVLAFPLLVGTALSASPREIWTPDTPSELITSLAYADSYRPTTVAGAVDTYAKSLIYGNGVMRYAITPDSERAELAKQLISNNSAYITSVGGYGMRYKVYNGIKTDIGYEVILRLETVEGEYEYITVAVVPEKSGYAAYETDKEVVTVQNPVDTVDVPLLSCRKKSTVYGDYTHSVRINYTVSQGVSDSDFLTFNYDGDFDIISTPVINAEFESGTVRTRVYFEISDTAPSKPINEIGLSMICNGGRSSDFLTVNGEWNGTMDVVFNNDITAFEPLSDEIFTVDLLIDDRDSPVETVILKD